MDHKKVNIKQTESIRLHAEKDKMIINRFHVSLIRFVIGESLLVEVFVISRIFKVEVVFLSRSRRLRLITPTLYIKRKKIIEVIF